MKRMEDFYLELLNSNKSTGYMFKNIPMPQGMPILFSLANIALFSLMGIYFGNVLILAIPCFILIWEHYTVAVKRNKIYDECILNEVFMQEDFKTNGADPNFPEEPLYVTNEDRLDIFDEALVQYHLKKEGFLQKIKNHHVFLLTMVVLYILCYLFIRFLFNSLV